MFISIRSSQDQVNKIPSMAHEEYPEAVFWQFMDIAGQWVILIWDVAPGTLFMKWRMATILLYFYCCDKYHSQKQPEGEKAYLAPDSRLQAAIAEKARHQEVEAVHSPGQRTMNQCMNFVSYIFMQSSTQSMAPPTVGGLFSLQWTQSR